MNRRQLLGSAAGLAAVAFGRTLLMPSAAVSTQTPESFAIAADTELDVVFQPEWLPDGPYQGALYRIVLEPGQELSYLPGPYCGCSGERIQEGTATEVVMTGTYAIELDRSFIVRRDGANDEEIGSDTAIELRPNDVAIYPDAIASGTLQNIGDDPLILYGASITGLERESGTLTPDLPEGASARLSVARWEDLQSFGDYAIRATMSKRTFEPSTSLETYEIIDLETVHAMSGEFESAVIHPGYDEPVGDPRHIREGGSVIFEQFPPGTRRVLSNPFSESAELLTLRFSRSDRSS